MKKTSFAVILLALCTLAACEKKSEIPSPKIDGLTLENFPVIDGSTSTDPLVRTIACELLGYNYRWDHAPGAVTFRIETYLPEFFMDKKIFCSQTHNAIENLIIKYDYFGLIIDADIVFSARKLSPDERALAEKYDVEIIETPIALDALVFITHDDVTAKSLTRAQIEKIYTAKIKNWSEINGQELPIIPYVRNANSGSQELMLSMVMSEPLAEGFYEEHYADFQHVSAMYPLLTSVGHTAGGLGYTIYYYLTQIVRERTFDELKMMAVDGVEPNKTTIADRSYPFVAEVYMIIRKDLDRSSAAWKVYEFLQTKAGKNIIAKSGYVPI